MTTDLVTVGKPGAGRRGVTLPAAALFAVTCPVCGAGPSQRCLSPTVGRVSPARSHKARADLAAQGGPSTSDSGREIPAGIPAALTGGRG
jgi:hypothetical protein